MNIDPYWAQGFAARTGRQPNASDFQKYQEASRNGGQPEPGTADKLLPYAGTAGSLAGMYGMSQLAGVGASAGAGAGAAGAGTAGMSVAGSLGAAGAGAAGTGAAGTGAAGAAGAGTMASVGAVALPVAAAVAAGYNLHEGYKLGEGKGAARGMKAALNDWDEPGFWLAPGSRILGGMYGGLFGSSKGEHQIALDGSRDNLEEMGVYQRGPADDSNFTMDLDGGYRLDDGRRSYEIVKGMAEGDPNATFSPEQGRVASILNTLGYVAGRGSDSDRDINTAGNTVGLLYNHLNEGGDQGVTDSELRDLYDQALGGHGGGFEALNQLASAGMISQEEQMAAHNALNDLYGEEYYTPEDNRDTATRTSELLGRLYG